MIKYPKINAPYFRHKDGKNKGKLIPGQWSEPEFEYLADNQWEWTEKIDGCVSPKTNIRMADGSRKRITDIKVGDYVLGHNGSGVVSSRVQAVKMQPPAGEWVRVRATRNGLGSGNSFGQVVCTHDHKIWTPDRGWVEAYRLKVGDKVLSSRTDVVLTPVQEQVLTGKMLGDGSLAYHDSSNTASVEFGHISEELVDWTLRGLGELAGNKGSRISGYGSNIITGRSKQMHSVYEVFREWIGESKQVPKNIDITPIVMAFWYMDDGSLSHNDNQEDRLHLATNAFNNASCHNLVVALERLGISAQVKDYKGNTICLNSENAERFFLMITPYIPAAMQYKLPERYRGYNSWLPEVGNGVYKSLAVEQTVTGVDRVSVHQRWDIQTETSNFFTVGMLVHNTNTRIHLSRMDKIVFATYAGRTDNAVLPQPLLEHLEATFPTFPSHRRDLHASSYLERYRQVVDWMINNDLESVTLFGEGYGPKIQGGGKYRADQSFILFDVNIGDTWLSREKANDVAYGLGIDSVPVVGTGTLTQAIDVVRDGYTFNRAGAIVRYGRDGLQSKFGEFEAEGLVVRPVVPLLNRQGDRITTKIKGKDFK